MFNIIFTQSWKQKKKCHFPPSESSRAGSDYRHMNELCLFPSLLYKRLKISNKIPAMMLTEVLPLASAGNKSCFY